MAEINAILDIYNKNENKVEDDMLLGGVPRTSHSMSKIIEKLSTSPVIPKRHLSQKEVRKMLFDGNDEDYIVYHESDLDQDSDHSTISISSSQGEREGDYISMDSDHSLARVIAYHVYADQDRFGLVEEDIMKHVRCAERLSI